MLFDSGGSTFWKLDNFTDKVSSFDNREPHPKGRIELHAIV